MSEDAAHLAELLTQAEEAHRGYESKLGHPDSNWAEFYAQFMAAALNGQNHEAFVQGELRMRDFSPAGTRKEGPYENDRNADSERLFEDILAEVYGAHKSIIGHHLTYQVSEKGPEGYVLTYSQEIPSADTLIFDHDVAKKLWGGQWEECLRKLACEPTNTRDKLLAELYYAPNRVGKVA